jgi:hypothetical protein
MLWTRSWGRPAALTLWGPSSRWWVGFCCVLRVALCAGGCAVGCGLRCVLRVALCAAGCALCCGLCCVLRVALWGALDSAGALGGVVVVLCVMLGRASVQGRGGNRRAKGTGPGTCKLRERNLHIAPSSCSLQAASQQRVAARAAPACPGAASGASYLPARAPLPIPSWLHFTPLSAQQDLQQTLQWALACRWTSPLLPSWSA